MKRYRAKRTADIYADVGIKEVYLTSLVEGQILQFNPDDFEEVEEETKIPPAWQKRIDSLSQAFKEHDEEEKEIEPPPHNLGTYENNLWAREITKVVNKIIKER